MKRCFALITAFVSCSAGAGSLGGPLTLEDEGSFFVNGKVVTSQHPGASLVTGPAAPGRITVNQMYVHYRIPASRKGPALVLVHGSNHSGVTYETTPDGREGWLNLFIRKGWDVYNSDAVERGRSGFAPPDVWNSEPNFLTKANPFERFRIGQGLGSWNADPAKMKVNVGSQFPVEAYDNFTKQIVPRWTNTDDAIIAAYTALVDKVCPCVLLFHSQAGGFGFTVAQARPDKIKAIVAVEPAVAGDKAQAGRLKNIPTLVVYGDYIPLDSRWPKMRQIGVDYAEAIRAAGGSADVVNLPDVGIKGNSHMLMMDKNNAQVSDLIQKWLTDKGLVE